MTSAARSLPATLVSAPASAIAVALALTLAACTSTPIAPPPPAAAPAQFKEVGLWQGTGAASSSASAAEPAVPADWWQAFNDPVLTRLQSQLVIGNENLKIALAQVANARALLGANRAAQEPTLGATAGATRADSGISTSTTAANRQPANSFSLGLNAAWELDLWGRLSQATQAGEARLQASEADLAAARLSAQATLVQTYFALRGAEAQQAIINRSIEAYQRSVNLTTARVQAGVAPPTDLLQAQTQLKTAQVQALEASNQRALFEHAIAVLLGQSPSALDIALSANASTASASTTTQALPPAPTVPQILPSTVLRRRPDIAAAERRVAAAYAQIGVADAAFFPSLTLGANAGLRGSTLDQLVSAPTLFWSLGPALAQKIFDGGALRSASDQARANADQATASYRQTVLTALQEVEDNLLLADRLRSEAELQADALRYAQRNLDITQEQYRVGTVSYLNVVTAQTTALNSERTLLDLRLRQINAANQLLKNVAGRWQ